MDSLELVLWIMGITALICVALFIGSFFYYDEIKDVCEDGSNSSLKQITSDYFVCGETYQTFTEDEGYTVKVRHWKVPR